MEITGYDIDCNMFKTSYYADDIPSGKIMLTCRGIEDGTIRPYLKMPEGSYYQNNPAYLEAGDDYNPNYDFDAIDLTTGYLCALNKRGIKVYEFKGKIKVKNKIGEKDFKEVLDEKVDGFPVEVRNEYNVKVNKVDIRVVRYKYFDNITGRYLYNDWNLNNDKKWTLCMENNYFGFRFDSVLFRSNNLSTYDCFRPYTAYESSRFLNYHGAGHMMDSTGVFVKHDLGMIPTEEEVWIKV